MMFSGGPVFWILAAMAAAAVVIFLERFFELRRARIDYQDFIKGVVNILDRGNADEALAICDDTSVPVSNIVAAAIRQKDGEERLLREAVDAQGRAEVGRLDRRLAALAIIGQVAPLVGLFGTLIGFLRTVGAAETAALVSQPDLFTSAADAIVSTALGLLVAILAAVTYGALRVRMDRLVVELEAAASQIVGYFAARKEPA
jgi:biopolymer transport protein ExbB